MTKDAAKTDIMKALDSYDDGRITKATFAEAVGEVLDRLDLDAYDRGYEAAYDGDDEVEFEPDEDMLDGDDDHNSDLEDGRDKEH
jgi:hypothetical protein